MVVPLELVVPDAPLLLVLLELPVLVVGVEDEVISVQLFPVPVGVQPSLLGIASTRSIFTLGLVPVYSSVWLPVLSERLMALDVLPLS